MMAIDTNILVYASDAGAGDRHFVAKAVLKQAIARGTLILPIQVLGEFCHVAVRKVGHDMQKVEEFVLAWSAVAQVEGYGLADVRAALRARAEHALAFWDALIWAVCERIGAGILVSEDFQDGRRLGCVTFLNPFNPANASLLGLKPP
jgi:predicted nucleic acid-binding protein